MAAKRRATPTGTVPVTMKYLTFTDLVFCRIEYHQEHQHRVLRQRRANGGDSRPADLRPAGLSTPPSAIGAFSGSDRASD